MGLFNSKKIILDEAELEEGWDDELKVIGLDRLDFENKIKLLTMLHSHYKKVDVALGSSTLPGFIFHENLIIISQLLDQKDKLDKLIEQNNESKEMNQKLIEQNDKIIELLTKISEK